MPEASRCVECKQPWTEYASAALDGFDRHYYFASLDDTHPDGCGHRVIWLGLSALVC